MAGEDDAAVGHRIEEGLAPVPGGVHAHGEPKISGAAKSQAEKQSDGRRSQCPDDRFSLIAKVDGAERCRKEQSRRPEADAFGERELGVSAGDKLFKKTDRKK